MSIIAEALRRAEMEKGKSITSKENMDKVLGPQRKQVYKKTGSDAGAMRRKETALFPESRVLEPLPSAGRLKISKTIFALGGLLVLAAILLAATNRFIVYSPNLDIAAREEEPIYSEGPAEAEAYAVPGPEAELIGGKTKSINNAVKRYLVDNDVISNFRLTGIVLDGNDPWAVINDSVVRAGDIVGGAEVVSIGEQKVVLLLEDATFDLKVR